MERKVLVTFATRHGSTGEIAQRIAATLQVKGVDATAMPVSEVKDAAGYDGYVIGSAVYALHWLGDAKQFVHRNRELLRRHPVWLFSSGPLSTDDDDRREAAPRDIADLAAEVDARGHLVFAGAWDQDAPPIGVMEKVMHVFPAARNALPDGDFRDWASIDDFALGIAGELDLALATP
jgi:menaquinone-dependent protoporphyrinogen oxidase